MLLFKLPTMWLTLIILIVILFAALWGFSKHFPCPVWVHRLIEMDNPFTKANQTEEIIKNLDLSSGMHVLDAGCGPGRLSIPMAKSIGAKGFLTAMDLQEGMLDIVRKKAQESNLGNILYLQAGIGEGKLQPGQYDRIILVTVLGEIPQQEKAMLELYQSLKEGGILAITESIFDPHFQKKELVLRLALSCGFKVKGFAGNRLAYTYLFKKPNLLCG